MRIVSGTHAGRHLTSPGRRVRPTSEVVRDQWISRLEGELRGARVLDLFAGSGALGLEALSRGARSADFVENGAAALHALKANVAALRERKRSRIFKRDAIPYVARLPEGAYDIALVDPPYGSRKLDRILQAWAATPFAHFLCVEHGRDTPLPSGGQTRWHGDTGVTFFRAQIESQDRPDEPS